MMFYGTQSCGRRSSNYPLNALRSEKLNGTPGRACSEKGESRAGETATAFRCNSLRTHCEVIMTNAIQKRQAQEV